MIRRSGMSGGIRSCALRADWRGLIPAAHPCRRKQAPKARGPIAVGRQRQPRSLAGATILQLVPALRDDPPGRAAVDIALALLQSGARAIIAGEGGPLVGELRASGGEWLPMTNDTFNPLRIQRQCAAAGAADRGRAHRHRACPERRRRLERRRRHRPDAGVPGHLVPRPAARRISGPARCSAAR